MLMRKLRNCFILGSTLSLGSSFELALVNISALAGGIATVLLRPINILISSSMSVYTKFIYSLKKILVCIFKKWIIDYWQCASLIQET